ncbi:MAG: lipoyl domain-containing protein, partial [Anaerolineales bacterium]|nr:lipoyl domain-containing protein [Anaerolineales bacterium]
MSDAKPVLIPLLNANEPEAQLIGLHVQAGQQVAPGDLLCTLETTKSAAEVEAESGGYVAGLAFAEGDTVKAGDVFCYLADSPDWTPPQPQSQPETETAE